MNIDISIVRDYLSGSCEYKNHWIFRSIDDDGVYLFDCPSEEDKEVVQNALNDTLKILNDFHPYNLELFQRLFPKWRELCKTVNVIISVGCPAPYDAMVREHEGKEFIIIDLIRILDYRMGIRTLVTPFFTHELSHICIHTDYSDIPAKTFYRDELKSIVFDEGFAHLLSYRDNIENVDFSSLVQEYYQQSFCKLKSALCEIDTEKQKICLTESNSGEYWKKYGAICGKLYLARNIDDIETIYKAGPEKMFNNIVKEANACLPRQ